MSWKTLCLCTDLCVMDAVCGGEDVALRDDGAAAVVGPVPVLQDLDLSLAISGRAQSPSDHPITQGVHTAQGTVRSSYNRQGGHNPNDVTSPNTSNLIISQRTQYLLGKITNMFETVEHPQHVLHTIRVYLPTFPKVGTVPLTAFFPCHFYLLLTFAYVYTANAPKGSEIIICTTSNGGHLNIMHVALHGKNKHP